MKKAQKYVRKTIYLFVFLFFAFLPVTVFAQNNSNTTTIQIETSQGKTPLIVPNSYDQLKQAYITMAKLYIEERYAHKKSLNQVDQLLGDVATMKSGQKKLEDQITNLNNQIDVLNKQLGHKKFFQFGIDGFYQTNLVNMTPIVGVGIRAEILQQFGIRIDYSPLTSVQIGFDWKLGG